ncbi:rod shape-determining protein MreC [Bacteroides sp. 224]|uniref:rod shape-determining protein MreC n=1 Tax=Bacteroides sp. 224 TaxID=2302936 RepID=UPI0013D7968C|nr:rod shape-determining protein MreC [Bacteroides sp. 224]NDV66798.1 rod shape-determining protein MreC [Bacteroides sp. 224]
MRNLLDFLIKYNYWFLFILLEVVCFGLLFRFNHYQQGVFFSSANVLTGAIYEVSGGISSYFHLKQVNDALIERNIELEAKVVELESVLKDNQLDSVFIHNKTLSSMADIEVFKAHVINNTVNKVDNYITLNKGTIDGIKPEMGVIDGRGVVGIVYMTSTHYSVAISLLNSKSNISCKIKGSDYFGYLRWEYGNEPNAAYLKDLPRHAEFNIGDTVITSGYSTVFPEGIMVGTIEELGDSHDGLSYLLKVKLATDFGKISNVRIISREGQNEQHDLEKNSIQ